MVTDKIKQLAQYEDKVAQLRKTIEDRLRRELASLPEKYGFDSTQAFIAAVKQASGGKRSARGGALGKKRRKRAKITPEMKQKLKSLVEHGKTGTEIAKILGISLPSVQNIKKELGLVKARK
ncbi:MAG: helix-turn-helix domain-containing protein [Patescibacteria group bacterium]|nr:helix-turn-helix domain-containing protein [Patescibacteria group bacterium]